MESNNNINNNSCLAKQYFMLKIRLNIGGEFRNRKATVDLLSVVCQITVKSWK